MDGSNVRAIDALLDGDGDRVPRFLHERYMLGAVVIVVEGRAFGRWVVDADSDHGIDRNTAHPSPYARNI